jgi:hypothetical protein
MARIPAGEIERPKRDVSLERLAEGRMSSLTPSGSATQTFTYNALGARVYLSAGSTLVSYQTDPAGNFLAANWPNESVVTSREGLPDWESDTGCFLVLCCTGDYVDNSLPVGPPLRCRFRPTLRVWSEVQATRDSWHTRGAASILFLRTLLSGYGVRKCRRSLRSCNSR